MLMECVSLLEVNRKSFCQIWLMLCVYKSLRCLDLEIAMAFFVLMINNNDNNTVKPG